MSKDTKQKSSDRPADLVTQYEPEAKDSCNELKEEATNSLASFAPEWNHPSNDAYDDL